MTIWTEQAIKDEMDRLDAEDAATDARINQIKQIATDNAKVALDQSQVDEYQDNMNDTLVEMFSDLSNNEWNIAQNTYLRIVGR